MTFPFKPYFCLRRWTMNSFWCLQFLLSLCLTSGVSTKRVLLRDVSTLTFSRGQNTNARRSSPIPQLKCIGGSAYHERDTYPSVAQCYNRGFDGQDVQWECRAELPKTVFLGRVRVNCEGYDYPDDPYILAGSCGLEYELEYSGKKRHHHSSIKRVFSSPNNMKYAALLGLLGLAALIWYCCLSGSHTDGDERYFVRREEEPFTNASAPPPFPAEDPPPYDEALRSRPVPPYDDTWAHRRTAPTPPPSYGWADLRSGTSQNANSWTSRAPRPPRPSDGTPRKTEHVGAESPSGSWLTGGLLAGAGLLGGYLLHSVTNDRTTESTVRTERTHQSRMYPTCTESEIRHSSTDSDDERRHVSTSFGSTTRR